MTSIRQNILVSNSNKSVLYDLNNDVTLNFPSTLFFKAPNYLELINFDLSCEINIFGNTNNAFYIIYDYNGIEKKYEIVIPFNKNVRSDYDLAQLIKSTLNSISYVGKPNLVFDVNESSISNIVTNQKIEVDSSTTSYSIKASEPVNISFDHKDTIGFLIGFGSGIYYDVVEVSGTSTQSITAYMSIDCVNDSGSTNEFPNFNDFNCKMMLFDANGDYIPNAVNSNDFTISINSDKGLVSYYNIGDLLREIENKMNDYSNLFTPAANFSVEYDYTLKKVKISNITSSRFGIGFDLETTTNKISSGSLHKVLGFEQRNYINIHEITSPKPSISYENTFADDYVLICSDISNSSLDLNIIGIGSGNNIKNNNILFAIPLNKISNFSPQDSNFYRVSLSNSSFSIGYKNKVFNDNNPNLVSFYLRLLSGRSISTLSQKSKGKVFLKLSFLKLFGKIKETVSPNSQDFFINFFAKVD